MCRNSSILYPEIWEGRVEAALPPLVRRVQKLETKIIIFFSNGEKDVKIMKIY